VFPVEKICGIDGHLELGSGVGALLKTPLFSYSEHNQQLMNQLQQSPDMIERLLT
jgi:hypothetical protein